MLPKKTGLWNSFVVDFSVKMIMPGKKILTDVLARKTITHLLGQVAGAGSLLLVALFLVQAGLLSDVSWPGMADLLLKILPVLLCGWLTIRLFRYIRTRFKQPLAPEKAWKQQAGREDIQVLKAQIQPHFLFNTLNRISASIPPQQEETRELIAKLADTFRYALQATKEDEVCLGDELHFIQTYLELEKERFADRLQVSIDACQEVRQLKIAPMLLQPLIENAVIHGIAPAVDGGSIHLSCHKQDDKVCIRISNTGKWFTGPVEWLFQGEGVGLRNTALRLEKIYRAQMRIEKNTSGGLTFTFCIPARA